MLKGIVAGVAGIVILFILIQFIPYGHDHINPPPKAEPNWNSPETRALAVRACFDCHSDLTVWPWYSNVAPMSWLIQRDVDRGRRRLDFTQWTTTSARGAREAASQIQRGEMPQWYYVLIHPSANLSAQEKTALEQGLSASLAQR
jgi:hypothetical protein